MDYLDLTIGTLDPEELRQDGRDYLQAQSPPGWQINPFVDWILGAVARMAVLVLVLASKVPLAIFKAFGTTVLQVPALQATTATGTVTITASSGAGGTLAAGAQIAIDGAAFVTAADVIVAAAGTATVAVQASEAGAASSGLPGTDTVLVAPSTTWVDSVSLNSATVGGVDGEDDDAYVNRLADELPTLSPKAVVIGDVSAIARGDLEVARALAIDNFVPPSTTGVAGAVTVAVADADGQPVSAAAKTRVQDSLEANRILGIDAHVIDPTYTAVDISFQIQRYTDADETATLAAAKQAITDLLSGAVWGTPPGATSDEWVDETTLRRNDIVVALGNVKGVRHVLSVTLALHGGALGTADVTLTGPAAIPTIAAANLNGTITT